MITVIMITVIIDPDTTITSKTHLFIVIIIIKRYLN